MTGRDAAEAIAAVLCRQDDTMFHHDRTDDFPCWSCKEKAAALVARGIGVLAEAKAEALREAADEWQVGGWANVLLPHPEPPAVPLIAYSNRVLDWLRARIEATP